MASFAGSARVMALVAVLGLGACGDDDGTEVDGGAEDAGPRDASIGDGGSADGGVEDAAVTDAGSDDDAGVAIDGGGTDGGASPDGGAASDGGTESDAGEPDGGPGDAGPPDAGEPDGGPGPVTCTEPGLTLETISDTASSGTPDSYFRDVRPGDPFCAEITGGGSGTWTVNVSNGTSSGLYCTGSATCAIRVPEGDTTLIVTAVTTDIGGYTLRIHRIPP